MRARVGTSRPWDNGFSLITIQYVEQNEYEEFQRNGIVYSAGCSMGGQWQFASSAHMASVVNFSIFRLENSVNIIIFMDGFEGKSLN